MTFEAIVSAYIHDHRADARDEMRFFESQPSLVDAIRNAVRPGGRKHEHQYRIPSALLDEAERRLKVATANLVQAPDFATLHALIDSKIGRLPGIGPLTVYDIAHRLGAFLGKTPVLVYLHSGAKTGAAALGFRGKAIRPEVLPAAFLRLSATEIEDCLCLYSDHLRGDGIRTRHFRHPSHCRDITFPRERRY